MDLDSFDYLPVVSTSSVIKSNGNIQTFIKVELFNITVSWFGIFYGNKISKKTTHKWFSWNISNQKFLSPAKSLSKCSFLKLTNFQLIFFYHVFYLTYRTNTKGLWQVIDSTFVFISLIQTKTIFLSLIFNQSIMKPAEINLLLHFYCSKY